MPFKVLILVLCASRALGAADIRFSDVTLEAGIFHRNVTGSAQKSTIVESLSGGAAFLDYDQDGWQDLYIVNGSTAGTIRDDPEAPRNALYRNLGNGRFEDVTERSGTGDTGWGMGSVAFDYDGDGWTDLYVTNWGADVLYRNRGDGTFQNATTEAGLGNSRWGAGCAAADYDGDGDLDLFVANHVMYDEANPPNGGELCFGYRGLRVYCGPHGLPPQPDILYRNNGDGTFADISAEAGIVLSRYSLGALWTDYDSDGDPDLLVAVDSQANLLYRNDGPWPGGHFTETALLAGIAYSGDGSPQAGMGIASGDFDGDGRLDLYLTHFSDDYNTLYRNEGEGYFQDVTWSTGLAGVGVPHLGWGTAFVDVENDGDLDLFIANGHIFPQVGNPGIGLSYAQSDQLLLQADGRFNDHSSEAGLESEFVSRGAAFGDYDNDGDVDVLVINLNDRPRLLRNDTQGAGSWLKVALEGAGVNSEGVGARVEVSRGAKTWVQEARRGESYLCSNDPRLHFGLGSPDSVSVTVVWPGGETQTIDAVAVNHLLVVREDGTHSVLLLNADL